MGLFGELSFNFKKVCVENNSKTVGVRSGMASCKKTTHFPRQRTGLGLLLRGVSAEATVETLETKRHQ